MDGLNTLSAVGSLPEGAIEAIKLRTKNAAKYCHTKVCAWIDSKAAKFVSGIKKQCTSLCDQAAGALTTKLGKLAGKVKETDMANAICDKAFAWMDKKLRL